MLKICFKVTLPETDIEPENGWLEYDRFLLGPGLFSGAFAVSFREGQVCCHLFCLYLASAIFPMSARCSQKITISSPSHHTLSRYRSSQSCEHGGPCINHGSVEEMAKYLKGI